MGVGLRLLFPPISVVVHFIDVGGGGGVAYLAYFLVAITFILCHWTKDSPMYTPHSSAPVMEMKLCSSSVIPAVLCLNLSHALFSSNDLSEQTLCNEMRLSSSLFSSDMGRYSRLIIHIVTSKRKLFALIHYLV